MGNSDWFTPEYARSEHEEYCAIRLLYPELIGELAFECRAGWYGIINDFLDEVRKILLADSSGAAFGLIQVKEKLGGLRLYTYEGPAIREAIDAARERAEAAASVTCDVCAKPGVLRKRVGGSILATRCDEHAEGGVPVREEKRDADG